MITKLDLVCEEEMEDEPMNMVDKIIYNLCVLSDMIPTQKEWDYINDVICYIRELKYIFSVDDLIRNDGEMVGNDHIMKKLEYIVSNKDDLPEVKWHMDYRNVYFRIN